MKNTILKTSLNIGITNFSNKIVIGNVFHFDYLDENTISIVNNGITINIDNENIFNLVHGYVFLDGEKLGTIIEYEGFPNLLSISCLDNQGKVRTLLIDKKQQCIATTLSYDETNKLINSKKTKYNIFENVEKQNELLSMFSTGKN